MKRIDRCRDQFRIPAHALRALQRRFPLEHLARDGNILSPEHFESMRISDEKWVEYFVLWRELHPFDVCSDMELIFIPQNEKWLRAQYFPARGYMRIECFPFAQKDNIPAEVEKILPPGQWEASCAREATLIRHIVTPKIF